MVARRRRHVFVPFYPARQPHSGTRYSRLADADVPCADDGCIGHITGHSVIPSGGRSRVVCRGASRVWVTLMTPPQQQERGQVQLFHVNQAMVRG
jgi:hypothetical protein